MSGHDTTIRDSLYDRIVLAPHEVAVLRSTAFVRLEGIKQLGFVSRVWPGARHTRFDHSLGVFALTRRALSALRPALVPGPAATAGGTGALGPLGPIGGRSGAVAVDRVAIETLAAAALLHDVGHYPFSHAIEELGPPVLDHEAVGRRLIETGELADLLEREWGVDPGRVADLIDRRGRRRPLAPADRLLAGLLSGMLDVDKLDYLPRDARACNVPYGGVDVARLLDALTVAEVEGERRIVVTGKGVGALHSLNNARQEMFDNVYWHHTNRTCMAMLLRAVQDALLAGAVAPEALTAHDDASLLALLAAPGMPDATRTLTGMLRTHQVHRRVVEVSTRAADLYAGLAALHDRPAARRAVEVALAAAAEAALGVPVAGHEVLIDIPKPEKWQMDAWVRFADPPLGMRALMPWHEVVGLLPEDFKRYEASRRLIRIVAAPHLRDRLRAVWDTALLPAIAPALARTAEIGVGVGAA